MPSIWLLMLRRFPPVSQHRNGIKFARECPVDPEKSQDQQIKCCQVTIHCTRRPNGNIQPWHISDIFGSQNSPKTPGSSKPYPKTLINPPSSNRKFANQLCSASKSWAMPYICRFWKGEISNQAALQRWVWRDPHTRSTWNRWGSPLWSSCILHFDQFLTGETTGETWRNSKNLKEVESSGH